MCLVKTVSGVFYFVCLVNIDSGVFLCVVIIFTVLNLGEKCTSIKT